MPLITCPDCEARISDLAPACPHCGRPADADLDTGTVQPIELTAKHWKGLRMAGWAVALGGALLASSSLPGNEPARCPGNFRRYRNGRLERAFAWWHHG